MYEKMMVPFSGMEHSRVRSRFRGRNQGLNLGQFKFEMPSKMSRDCRKCKSEFRGEVEAGDGSHRARSPGEKVKAKINSGAKTPGIPTLSGREKRRNQPCKLSRNGQWGTVEGNTIPGKRGVLEASPRMKCPKAGE